eukprot:3574341-Amphidinium_carterae.1
MLSTVRGPACGLSRFRSRPLENGNEAMDVKLGRETFLLFKLLRCTLKKSVRENAFGVELITSCMYVCVWFLFMRKTIAWTSLESHHAQARQ